MLMVRLEFTVSAMERHYKTVTRYNYRDVYCLIVKFICTLNDRCYQIILLKIYGNSHGSKICNIWQLSAKTT